MSLGTVLLLSASLLPSVSAQEINLRNANFHLEHADLTVQKPGTMLEILRVYNSRSNESGLFGYGWSSPLDTAVRLHADGSLMVVDDDGFILTYTPTNLAPAELRERFVQKLINAQKNDDKNHGVEQDQAHYDKLKQEWLDKAAERERASYRFQSAWIDPTDGEYRSFDRGTETIVKRGETFTRTRANGLVETFNLQGRLIGRVDTAGKGIRIDYDRSLKIQKVSHTDGGSFTFAYDDKARIVSATDTESRAVTFGYDPSGNLLQVKGPEKRAIAYAYDDEHNLVAVNQAFGSGFQVQYDKVKDWAVALKHGEQVTRYAWDVIDPDKGHFVCTVTDPAGNRTRHEFNDKDHVALSTDSQGGVTRTLYSACCNKPIEVRAPSGAVTRYDYDSNAHLTGVSRPDGTTVRYTFHPQHNRIVQATFSDGRRFTYGYDEGGRVVTVEASDGTRLSLAYGPNGKAQTITAADGTKYVFEYDVDGHPLRIQGRKGAVLALSYGLTGELVGSQISSSSESVKQMFYNDLRKVLAMLEPATGEF